MKRYINKILIGAIILSVLGIVFWWGGNAPKLRGRSLPPSTVGSVAETNVSPIETPVNEFHDKIVEEHEEDSEKPSVAMEDTVTADDKAVTPSEFTGDPLANFSKSDTEDNSDRYLKNSVPEEEPYPVEPENIVITDVELTCTLSVRCDTILKNIDWLDPEKIELVPKDGVIFAEKTVNFYEGESVFNVLLREMKKNKIHMEFVNIAFYNSAYIEGIHNIYEFDCGELSGWTYKVNDWFPNYGSSRYQLKQGDKIQWLYTCDLGADIGGYNARQGL